ncbi:MAG: methionine synthase [Acidimicrobiia bacterium]|nr:methionine synthase [Acidimicrobiia bacterium]MYB25232.1 methionine synthase [Acidimicrobiia bacterium]MYE67292.1 methionine synthase [Acidimicrobiia bacterium]MYJ13432.1 methionine synthase [Acidimicrobiia bacterium]
MTGASDVFAELLDDKGYVLADGAMGTRLFALGLTSGDSPERFNLLKPGRIRDVHRGHLRAGADLVLSNSFGANAPRLGLHNLAGRTLELNEAAARIAREAAEAERRRGARTVLVAGSMGPTGELLAPLGAMTAGDCEQAFAAQAEGLAQGGVDLLWIETMSDLGEVEAAVQGARRACDLPVAVTMSFDTHGHTMMGASPAATAQRLGGLELAALGANCGNNIVDTEAAALDIAAALPDVPVISKPNAGIPYWSGNTFHYTGTPEMLAAHAHRARRDGVQIIGGCCGSTPDHIAAIAAVLAGERPAPETSEPLEWTDSP